VSLSLGVLSHRVSQRLTPYQSRDLSACPLNARCEETQGASAPGDVLAPWGCGLDVGQVLALGSGFTSCQRPPGMAVMMPSRSISLR